MSNFEIPSDRIAVVAEDGAEQDSKYQSIVETMITATVQFCRHRGWETLPPDECPATTCRVPNGKWVGVMIVGEGLDLDEKIRQVRDTFANCN